LCGVVFFGVGVSFPVILVQLDIGFFHLLCDQILVHLKEIFKIPLLKFSNLSVTVLGKYLASTSRRCSLIVDFFFSLCQSCVTNWSPGKQLKWPKFCNLNEYSEVVPVLRFYQVLLTHILFVLSFCFLYR